MAASIFLYIKLSILVDKTIKTTVGKMLNKYKQNLSNRCCFFFYLCKTNNLFKSALV